MKNFIKLKNSGFLNNIIKKVSFFGISAALLHLVGLSCASQSSGSDNPNDWQSKPEHQSLQPNLGSQGFEDDSEDNNAGRFTPIEQTIHSKKISQTQVVRKENQAFFVILDQLVQPDVTYDVIKPMLQTYQEHSSGQAPTGRYARVFLLKQAAITGIKPDNFKEAQDQWRSAINGQFLLKLVTKDSYFYEQILNQPKPGETARTNFGNL
jgi:hypothetical protein